MESSKFLKLILRRWYVLILVPIISIAIAWYFVRKIPGSYRSQGKISTGLVDETQKVLNSEGTMPPESQINQEFSNLIEMMKLKKLVDQVSYELILHDLTTNNSFKAPSKLLNQLNPAAKKHAIEIYKQKLKQEDELNLNDPDQNGLFKVLQSLKYDEESLKNQLTIYRLSNSDFIYIEFSSENPGMSAFVVNELCRVFLAYYTRAVKENQYKASNYLQNLMDERYRKMNEKMNELKEYKINNKILNLYEQSKIVYTHLMLINSEKDLAEKNIQSYEAALKDIDGKFNSNDRKYLESSMTQLNSQITTIKQQLRTLSDRYIESNFDERYRRSIDSLQGILNIQINQLADKYIYDPLNTKKDLISQKLSLEVQKDIAKGSLSSLYSQLNELNNKFNKLVPFEAVVQSYERDIDLATREYLEVVTKYNQSNMESGFSVMLRQVQTAMPGAAESSKKVILALMAGIVSFTFCLLVFFIIFLLDKSITTTKELVQKTNLPVLGTLRSNREIAGGNYNIGFTNDSSPTLNEEKKSFRSLRFEIDQVFKTPQKILCVTSLKEGAGKTFVSINLANAFALMQKKVLLIDGNFGQPTISTTLQPNYFIENIFSGTVLPVVNNNISFTVAGNRGKEHSLLEINTEEHIGSILSSLPFDIIIIETENIGSENKAKEWMLFATQIISVFESGTSLSVADEQNINFLKSGEKFSGWVLNKAPSNS